MSEEKGNFKGPIRQDETDEILQTAVEFLKSGPDREAEIFDEYEKMIFIDEKEKPERIMRFFYGALADYSERSLKEKVNGKKKITSQEVYDWAQLEIEFLFLDMLNSLALAVPEMRIGDQTTTGLTGSAQKIERFVLIRDAVANQNQGLIKKANQKERVELEEILKDLEAIRMEVKPEDEAVILGEETERHTRQDLDFLEALDGIAVGKVSKRRLNLTWGDFKADFPYYQDLLEKYRREWNSS